MLKKLSLDQTKIYEQTIATYEIAKMLVDFVKGRKHYLSIGAEQGDVDTWDDLVIEKEKDHHIHIQIKRQTTDFSTDNCIRDRYIMNKRKGQLRDLSPIDESIKALAEWVKDPKNDLTKKEFHIELPTYEVKFKDGLTVRHFKEFIQVHYKPNETTSQGLAELAKSDTSVEKCFEWLTTWCGFDNWDQIIILLSIIKIKGIGSETDIESRTEDLLREIFISDKVVEVRQKIKLYVSDNTTFTGAIKPRALLNELMSFLQSNIPSWTQFEKQNDKWCISGINDIVSNTEIERPSYVIPKLWNGTLPQNLKINTALSDHCVVSDSLLRLAIHQTGNSNTHCINSDVIRSKIYAKIGGTLGIESNDIEILSIIENDESFCCEEIRRLASMAENRSYAEDMERTMHLETWNKVSSNIDGIINAMENSESNTLQDGIDDRWNIWKEQLSENTQEIGELLKSMVHPIAEGKNIKGLFRIGMRTAQLLAESLFFLLITSVSLDPDNNGSWKKIDDKLSLIAIGLRYWSGVEGKKGRVRGIDEDGEKIIGKENSNVLVFSKVTSSPNEMMEDLISNSKDQGSNSIADGKTPDLIITNTTRFRKSIAKGKIEEVRTYLKSQLRNSEDINQASIEEIIG